MPQQSQKHLIEITATVVEAEFTFLEMQIEVLAPNAPAFRQASFRGAPKALDAVDVDAAAADEDVVAMLDAEVFAVAEVNEPVIANPAVGVNDAGHIDATANNGPQSRTFRVRDDFRVDAALAFENTEDDGLPAGPAAAFAPNAASTEVRFVDFDGAAQRRMLLTFLGHPVAEGQEEAIDGAAADMGELRHLRRLEVEGKQPDDLAKFGLRNM